jgi:hypothetical protein
VAKYRHKAPIFDAEQWYPGDGPDHDVVSLEGWVPGLDDYFLVVDGEHLRIAPGHFIFYVGGRPTGCATPEYFLSTFERVED